MPSTTKWNLSVERMMPWNSTLKISYQGNHNDKRLKYALGNLPLSPLDGPITVVDHPNNAPAAGLPGSARQGDQRGRRRRHCAPAPASSASPTNAACPVAVPIADNEISLRVPRTNERRPESALHDQPADQQRRRALVRRARDRVGQAVQSHGLQFQAAYTFSKSDDTTSEATFVGAGDTNQHGPERAVSRGPVALPHAASLHASTAATGCRSSRTSAACSGRRSAAGRSSGVVQARLRHAVHASPPPAVDLDFDGFAEARPVMLDPSILGAHVDRSATRRSRRCRGRRSAPSTFGDIDRGPRAAQRVLRRRPENVDLALSKNFTMPWPGHSLAVRIEAFNAFNQVQFGFPVERHQRTPTFGRRSRAPPRRTARGRCSSSCAIVTRSTGRRFSRASR